MTKLTAARRDLAAFAAMVGHPLTDWQARALDLKTRITAIVAPRQSGKSRSLALLALHRAFRRPEVRVLIVSAGEEASRRLLAEVRRIAATSPLLRGSVVDEQAGLLTLTNGSEIRSVPSSERQIRGWSADLLLVDEAALVSDDVALGAALPTVAARPDARVVAASTPWSEGGFFHGWVHAGDSEHLRVHRWELAECGWIDRATVEAARAAMSPARFRAEYEAAWAGAGDAMFPRRLLERCAADFRARDLPELRGPARLLGGCDWGVSVDRSAFSAIARLPVCALNPDADPLRPVFVVACVRAWPPGEPLATVARDVAESPASFALLSSEANGVGAGPTEHLFRLRKDRDRRWVKRAVHTDAERKAAAFERLRWLADQDRLVLPREGELMRELAALRVELRPGGTEGIEAPRGHDDLADSLMLAAGPFRLRGHAGVALARLADAPSPETETPDLAEPEVETGAGLRLHRRPILQSVKGAELTMPPGREPEPEPDPRPEMLAAPPGPVVTRDPRRPLRRVSPRGARLIDTSRRTRGGPHAR